jgi:hypothetical protein
MGLQIVSAKQTADLTKHGVTVCVYSQSGLGKTTLVSTLPKTYWKNILIAEFEEGGVMRALHGLDIPFIQFSMQKDMIEALKAWNDFLKEFPDQPPYDKLGVKWLFINSYSELQKFLEFGLQYARGKKFITLKEYGDAANKSREYLRLLKSLNRKGINVMIEAHEDTYEVEIEGTGAKRSMLFPKVGRTFAKEFLHLIDFCGHMELRTKGDVEERIISFKPTMTVAAKRSFRGFPEVIPADYTVLFSELKKALSQGSEPPVETPKAVETQSPAPAGQKSKQNTVKASA